jgi:hypothetical protein
MVHPVAPPVPVPQPVVQPVMQPEPQPQPVVQPVPAPPQMVQPAPQLVASPLTPDVPIESMTDDELIAFLSNSMAETGAVVQGDSLLSLEELNARFLAEARAGESAPFAPISESFDVISPAMTGFAPDDSLSVTQYTGATAAIDGETLMVPSAETTTLIPDDSTMISAFHDLDESDQKSSKIRKPLWILGIVLWVTTVILLLMTTFGFMTYNNEVTKFGNYGIYYQRSETMEPDVPYGSLVVATKLKEGEGKLGDNVLFGIDPTGASDKVVLRRIVNVLRIDTQVDYDTILLTDRDTSREQFSSDQALMILRFAIPGLGFLIDLLIANVWWLIGAFVASLVLVGVFRPRRKEKDYVLQ